MAEAQPCADERGGKKLEADCLATTAEIEVEGEERRHCLHI